MAKKKKKPLGGKYKVRRFFLTTLLCVLVAAGGWLAYDHFDEIAAPVLARLTGAQGEAEASEPEPEPESVSVPEAVEESELEAEPEPEPEPQNPASASDWEMILVNQDNPLPEGYLPELETVTGSYRVDTRIADSIRRMFADAKESGINLMLCSAYRSEERQTENFNNKKQEYINQGKTEAEAIAVTATIIAEPGTSEHHTGLAVDIVTTTYQVLDSGFENTPAFKWLNENAHKYGFILRFPKDKVDITGIIYEPWHYRYVGVENAAIIKASGLCLEEYVALLSRAAAPAASSTAEDEPAA